MEVQCRKLLKSIKNSGDTEQAFERQVKVTTRMRERTQIELGRKLGLEIERLLSTKGQIRKEKKTAVRDIDRYHMIRS